MENVGIIYNQIEQEFTRHLIDCNDSKRAHFDLADYYYEKATTIHYIQSVGMAVIAAWLLSTQFDGILPNDHTIVRSTPTVLAIIVSILTIIDNICRFKEKAMTHEQAAKRYHTLWRSCTNWKTDFPSQENVEQARTAVQKYREQLNEINRDSPHLSSLLWKKVEVMRNKSGNKDYSVYNMENK